MIAPRLLEFAGQGARLERTLRVTLGAGDGAAVLHRRQPRAVMREQAAYAAAITDAWAVLDRVCPDLYRHLWSAAPGVIVFQADEAESFAAPAAPGVIFLREEPDAGVVWFVEELVHQGGHHLFHALTLDWDGLFAVARELPLGPLIGEPDDHRTMEDALHGVFTQSLMCAALCACAEAEVFDGRRAHELLGRLSFAMKRLHLDLLDVRRRELYTAAGEELVTAFEEAFDEVYRLAGPQITGFDLTNQPYAFSYDRFSKLNARQEFEQAGR